MNITVLSGSSRTNNNTMKLCLAMKQMAERDGHVCTVVDFVKYDLPFFNQPSIDLDHLTSFQSNLINGLDQAELVIGVTPEYNWLPSSEMVNMVHQLGSKPFAHLFDNKVFAFAGVSAGMGGRMPTVQLSYAFNKIISFLDTQSVISAKIFEAHSVQKAINDEGIFLEDNPMELHLARFMSYCYKAAERWRT